MGKPTPEEARRRLLRRRLKRALGRGGGDATDPPGRALPRRPDPARAPLSAAQERLWFLERLIPGTPLYNIGRAVTLEGPLDAGALAAAWAAVALRHEALRMAVSHPGGDGDEAPSTPCLVVAERVEPAMPRIDLTTLAADRRDGECRRLARRQARTPFDLARAPLHRVALVTMGEERHVLLFTVHHLVFDGWSLGVLFRDLGRWYRRALSGGPLTVAAAPRFGDFTAWEAARQGGEEDPTAAAVEWWRRRLADLEPVELPTDRPRGSRRGLRAGQLEVSLPAERVERVRAVGRDHDASLFMTLLTAWFVLLARHTGSSRVAVASPVANRERAASEEMIGFFVNTVVLDVDLEAGAAGRPGGGLSGAEALRRTRERVLDALAHSTAPFARVVEALAPGRSLSHAPLAQTSFALQNATRGGTGPGADAGSDPDSNPGLDLGPVRVRRIETVPRGATDQDLTLSLREAPDGGLEGVLLYDRDLFDAVTARRWLDRWHRLLDGLVARPRAPLADLDLLSTAERRRLSVDYAAGPEASHPSPRPPHLAALLRTSCRLHAGRVALSTAGGLALTYAELETWADDLARRLMAAGVGPDVRVGLFLDRSPEAVVAIAATALAGGAYVPLAPDYPPERLAELLADAAPAVVVTRPGLVEEADRRLGSGAPPVVVVDVESAAGGDGGVASPSPPLPEASADNLAYVLYTSGSTGRPKGVGVTQGGVVALTAEPTLAGGPEDVWLQLAPLSFDASVLEIWPALAAGGRLEVFPPELPSLDRLADTVAGRGVSVLFLTAGLFHQVVDSRPEALAGVRRLISGGDVLSPPHVERALAALAESPAPGLGRDSVPGGDSGSRRMVDAYGPTEVTVTATCFALAPGDRVPRPLPIGRPNVATRVYVLDAAGRLSPEGVEGEIWVSGAGLARGYLGRPARTALSFVPHPFSGRDGVPTGARAYRTGDQGRWRPAAGRVGADEAGDEAAGAQAGAVLEFSGRADAQVKLRGFRVEPGEVESALTRHPGLASVAVVVVGEGAAGKRLVAVFTPAEGGEAPPADALRRWLGERLPAHMVPAAFTAVDRLPRTRHGKLDRRALVRIAADAEVATGGSAPPRGPLEELVAGSFADLLDLPQGTAVGRDADFFHLGGHSLLATRLVARLGRDAGGGTEPLARISHQASSREGEGARGCKAQGESTPQAYFQYVEDGDRPATQQTRADSTSQQMAGEKCGLDLPVRQVFETPTVAGLAAALKRARAEAAAAGGAPAPALERRPRPLTPWTGDPGAPGHPDEPAASFGQTRLWVVDRMEPGQPTYNMPAAAALRGDLDVAALAAALTALVGRQEALRTVLPEVDGEPRQRVLPTATALGASPLPKVDLSVLPAAVARAEASRLSAAEGVLPFDLARGPLARFRLLRLGGGDHRLLFTVHHAVSDGWSTGILLRELAELYAAAVTGRPPALEPLPVRYTDYAAWQRRWLRGERLEAQVDHHRRQLAGVPVLDLPTDRPRPAVARRRGRRLPVRLDAGLGEAVRRFARRRGATPYMVLLAAFATLLGRYAGRDDLAVGTPVAGRRRPELDGLVGLFVNTLALRADLGRGGFADLVARLRETTLAAWEHQDVPFERLVEELAPRRDLAHTPIFQTLFLLQNAFEAGAGELTAGGLEIALAPVETATAKFEVTLSLEDDGTGGYRGWWVYRTDLFDRTTAQRGVEHFRTLLSAAVEAPETSLGHLPLLRAAERQQALVEWNDPPNGFDPDPDPAPLLPDLFARRVARHPDAVALVLEGRRRSYAELAVRAAAVARGLVRRGVGPEVRVGLAAERGFEMVAGLLGIVLAGGAYVPLDPKLPAKRLSFLAADSGVAMVLTHGEAAGSLPGAGDGVEQVPVDELADAERGRDPVAALAALPSPPPEAAAYVIYTSGSTGAPKGVVVSHAALANRLRFAAAEDFRPDDAFLHKTTLAFDVATVEIFGPLVAGGRVVLARPDGQRDPRYLVDLMARQGVTQASFPPILLDALLVQPGFTGLSSLRTVITGGETVPANLPGRFHGRMEAAGRGRPDLLNRYGPTETTISVTSWTCRPGAEERVLPIGRPTAGARLYLLDRHGEPVPVGLPGEIHIGGAPVARGYLGRPAKTAAAFVPDPFAGTPGGRLYRSGDLARFRPDGALEFLARVDRQVKVRGFRVELGEIEAAMRDHPGVREAAVVDLPDGPSRRLAAFWLGEEADSAPVPDAEALRAFLARRLPDHMVPGSFTPVDAFPLSPTGKVDRRALAALEPAERGGAGSEPPRGEAERTVAAIFAELLFPERSDGDERPICRDDDFFALGGHSLLATRLVARLRRHWRRELPLREVFENPTVAALAAALEDGRGEGRGPLRRLVSSDGEAAPPLVLIHPGGGGLLSYTSLVRELAALVPAGGVPVWGLRDPALEGAAPRRSVEAMARAYAGDLRDAFGGRPVHLAGWSLGGLIAYELATVLEREGTPPPSLTLIDAVVRPPGPADGVVGLLRRFALQVEAPLPALDLDVDDLEELPPGELIRRFGAAARRRGFLTEWGDRELARRWRVYRAHAEALRSYEPGVYGGGDVLVLEAERVPAGHSPSGGAWRRLLGEAVRVEPVAGDHASILRGDSARRLARRLAERVGEHRAAGWDAGPGGGEGRGPVGVDGTGKAPTEAGSETR